MSIHEGVGFHESNNIRIKKATERLRVKLVESSKQESRETVQPRLKI